MKRILPVLVVLVLLCGCGSGQEMGRVLSLRERLLTSDGCRFDAVITADYGDETYVFSMNCSFDMEGNMNFTVTDPQSIAGITGTISQAGGKLTFDDQALVFQMLADGMVTPVSAPWLLIKTLRGGYLSSCGNDQDMLRVMIDDSYESNALHLDVWLDGGDVPVRGEILWQGRRVLSVEVRNFSYV